MKALTNVKTGVTAGYIVGKNRVTTVYGDTYKVSSNDMKWLRERSNIVVGDIKAVGFLTYDN